MILYAGMQQFGIMRQEVIVMATVPAPDMNEREYDDY
jgi:hypothetical protein